MILFKNLVFVCLFLTSLCSLHTFTSTHFSNSITSDFEYETDNNFYSKWETIQNSGCDSDGGAVSPVFALMKSSVFKVYNFGFELPEDAFIHSITVSYVVSIDETTSHNLTTHEHGLLFGPTHNTEKIPARKGSDAWGPWKVTPKTRTCPSSECSQDPKWGRLWTAEEINSPWFGTYIQVMCGQTNTRAKISCVEISVEYDINVESTFSSSTSSESSEEPIETHSSESEPIQTSSNETPTTRNNGLEFGVAALGIISCYFIVSCAIVTTIVVKSKKSKSVNREHTFAEVSNDPSTQEI